MSESNGHGARNQKGGHADSRNNEAVLKPTVSTVLSPILIDCTWRFSIFIPIINLDSITAYERPQNWDLFSDHVQSIITLLVCSK